MIKTTNNFMTKISNVKYRLNRVNTITGENIYPMWSSFLRCKKNSNKNAPEYIDELERRCTEIEEQNGIYKPVSRVKELDIETNDEHCVSQYDYEKFTEWVIIKENEFAEICRISSKESEKKLYDILMNHVSKYYIKSNLIKIDFEKLSGNFSSDIVYIFSDYWFKKILIEKYIDATIGSTVYN